MHGTKVNFVWKRGGNTQDGRKIMRWRKERGGLGYKIRKGKRRANVVRTRGGGRGFDNSRAGGGKGGGNETLPSKPGGGN